MEHYIALLRGVNVGGNNIIAMSKLKTMFMDMGFQSVETYINSGNVLFLSDETNLTNLRKKIEAMIKTTFKLDIKVVVIPSINLIEALQTVPKFWGSDDSYRHNAIFLMDDLEYEAVIDILGEFDDLVDQVHHSNNIIFWSIETVSINKSKYMKIAKLPLYKSMTIRNSNTTKKLAHLSGIIK